MVDDTVRTVCLTLLRRRMVPSAELKIPDAYPGA